MQLFLDTNAHLPLNNAGVKSFLEFNSSISGHGHPSSLNIPGRSSSHQLELAREKIAKSIGAQRPSQIIFTHTCTEAADWAVSLLANKTEKISTSPLEHPAVYDSVNKRIPNVSKLISDSHGKLDYTGNSEESLVCVHVQNETGTIQPLSEFRTKCKYLFSDMSQSLCKIPINVSELNVDLACFSGHKFGGNFIGWMYLKDSDWYKEYQSGSRYFLDLSGTPNVIGIVSTAAALEESLATLPSRIERSQEFQSVLEKELKELGLEVIGETLPRVTTSSLITGFQGQAARILVELGEKKIYVGLGSACGSLSTGKSRLMEALDRDAGPHDNLRISQWGEYGKKEALYVVENIKRLFKAG